MKGLVFIFLAGFILTSVASATPVLFTTNDGAPYGPHRVQYITVYVDGVKKCYTESHGNCTSKPNLTPGLHKVDYVWAKGNAPPTSPIIGTTTHYVLVPDQIADYVVRIPTLRVRWYTPGSYSRGGTQISLNGQQVVFSGTTSGTANVLSGCYTASYFSPYGVGIPAWPSIPGTPDSALKGFDRICFGNASTYPAPEPDPPGTETNPPHVRITVPAALWP